jgi:hypothetical protein
MKRYDSCLFFFCLLLISCSAEKNAAVPELYQSWEVKDFISVESIAYIKNPNTIILLTFQKNGSYSLALDVNHCGGSFSSGGNNSVTISNPVCTEICCDSKFSEKLVQMLPQVTSFSFEENKLYLRVPKWGFVVCEPHQ